jgi:hypothetical protein
LNGFHAYHNEEMMNDAFNLANYTSGMVIVNPAEENHSSVTTHACLHIEVKIEGARPIWTGG